MESPEAGDVPFFVLEHINIEAFRPIGCTLPRNTNSVTVSTKMGTTKCTRKFDPVGIGIVSGGLTLGNAL